MSINSQSDWNLLLSSADSTMIFSHKDPEVILKNYSHVANGLLTTSILYLWAKQKSIYLVLSVNWRKKQVINHIIKSLNKTWGLDIDQNLWVNITVNSIIKKANSRLIFMYRKASCLSIEYRKTPNVTLTTTIPRNIPQYDRP